MKELIKNEVVILIQLLKMSEEASIRTDWHTIDVLNELESRVRTL